MEPPKCASRAPSGGSPFRTGGILEARRGSSPALPIGEDPKNRLQIRKRDGVGGALAPQPRSAGTRATRGSAISAGERDTATPAASSAATLAAARPLPPAG